MSIVLPRTTSPRRAVLMFEPDSPLSSAGMLPVIRWLRSNWSRSCGPIWEVAGSICVIRPDLRIPGWPCLPSAIWRICGARCGSTPSIHWSGKMPRNTAIVLSASSFAARWCIPRVPANCPSSLSSVTRPGKTVGEMPALFGMRSRRTQDWLPAPRSAVCPATRELPTTTRTVSSASQYSRMSKRVTSLGLSPL